MIDDRRCLRQPASRAAAAERDDVRRHRCRRRPRARKRCFTRAGTSSSGSVVENLPRLLVRRPLRDADRAASRCAGASARAAPGRATRSAAAACSLSWHRSQASVSSTGIAGERFLEHFHGAEHSRLHRSLGAAGDLRDLGIRQPLIAREQNRFALLRRQQRSALFESVVRLSRRSRWRSGESSAGAGSEISTSSPSFDSVLGLPQVIAAPVRRDREKPGRQFCAAMKLVRVLQHLDEDFLGRVFGRLAVLQEAVREVVDPAE